MVLTDPWHRITTDPASTDPLVPTIIQNNSYFLDFINILYANPESTPDKLDKSVRTRVVQATLSTRRDLTQRLAGTEAPSAKTESTDSGPIADGEISDQREQPAAGSPPDGSDSDKPDIDTGESEVEPLPKDKVFEILKNSRRRQALLYLKENGGDASLGELAEHIAAIENDCSPRAISSSQRKRVYVGLYQCHLPKMDDMHIVDFEKNRGTIELGANATQLDPYLEETQELAWSRIYFGITVLSIGLMALSFLVSAPLGVAPLVTLGVLLVGMAVTSGLQAYIEA